MRMETDARAPDGLVASGWRWVRTPGRVKFAKAWWSADFLKALVGQQVKVDAGDYHYSEVSVFDSRGRWRGTIRRRES